MPRSFVHPEELIARQRALETIALATWPRCWCGRLLTPYRHMDHSHTTPLQYCEACDADDIEKHEPHGWVRDDALADALNLIDEAQ
jgi:hypothetical protein